MGSSKEKVIEKLGKVDELVKERNEISFEN